MIYRKTELWLCLAAAVALVLLRSAVPLFWESVFNADQAIVGLMAKHLSEGKAFPLFFYGQNYMLGVQSWIAVPFFWIGGPTVTMLRAPLVLINAGVIAALIVMFGRLGLRPALAFVAVLPMAITTPVVSEALVETIGASIEPFAYVLLLWTLRRRPAWFGAVFCIAVLHREFVVFVAPAILLTQWRERRWWSPRQTLAAAAACAAVWLSVDLLKRTINAYGPAGGEHASSSLVMQAQQIGLWLSAAPAPYFERVRQVLVQALPEMQGGREYALSKYVIAGGLTVGSPVAGLALGLALAICIARLVTSPRRVDAQATTESFTAYLAVPGILSIAAYGLNSGTIASDAPIVRYLLFTLLLPVAALAAFLLREPSALLRNIVVALVCVWGACTAVDNGRLFTTYVNTPPPNPHRELADYMTAHNIRYGRGRYWDAYLVTFLSRERAVIASTEKVRISSYQRSVEQNAWHAVTLRRMPCETGVRVAAWCIEDPFEQHRR